MRRFIRARFFSRKKQAYKDINFVSGQNKKQDSYEKGLAEQRKMYYNINVKQFCYQEGREKMADLSNTQFIDISQAKRIQVPEVIRRVYEALLEKGYNPVNQIVGYIMSGDPTYITSYNNARSLIMKVERDEILEELMRTYIDARLRRDA